MASSGWTILSADITDEGAVDRLIADLKPAIVVHLAAQSSVTGQVESTWRVNFGGSFNLATAVARYAPHGLFFFSSSGEVYGRSFNGGPATEETCPQPLSAYAASKLAAEAMLRDVLPATSRLIVARSFNHTGPGQDERFVLPAFAAQVARIEAAQIQPVIKVGNLEAERDFLDVRDVVDAYVRLLRLPAAEAGSRLTVNISSGHPRSISDLLRRLMDLSRTPFRVEIDPDRLRPSDIPRAIGRSDRLAGLTGWTPARDFDTTISDLLNWWRLRVTA